MIDEFDGKVVEQLIRYIQAGMIDESLETPAGDLLLIADKYDVRGLKLIAEEQLEANRSVKINGDQPNPATLVSKA